MDFYAQTIVFTIHDFLNVVTRMEVEKESLIGIDFCKTTHCLNGIMDFYVKSVPFQYAGVYKLNNTQSEELFEIINNKWQEISEQQEIEDVLIKESKEFIDEKITMSDISQEFHLNLAEILTSMEMKLLFYTKPIVIIDLTYYEFKKFLVMLYEINLKLDSSKFSNFRDIDKERRSQLQDRIVDSFGEINMDDNKPPREIHEHNRPKMAANFLITFSNLNLISNPAYVEKLYNLYLNDTAKFDDKIKTMLLEDGRWHIILFAVEKCLNSIRNGKKSKIKKYCAKILHEGYNLKFPLKLERWEKQINYIWKWLEDLKFIEYNNQGYCQLSYQELQIMKHKRIFRVENIKGVHKKK